jgi:hypothetical protein
VPAALLNLHLLNRIIFRPEPAAAQSFGIALHPAGDVPRRGRGWVLDNVQQR